MCVRHALAALLAIVAASGCRALDSGSFSRAPEPLTPRSALKVTEIVERNNRNAELVNSLQAVPSVTVQSDKNGGAARGHMALERPHNFRMSLEAGINRQVADVGSNDEELWVWTGTGRDKESIYVCKYDGDGEIPGGLPFQPEWIVEGLGLRVIPREEEDQITTQRADKDPSSLVLVHRRINARGDATRKLTVVDATTGAIKRHIFFAPDGKTPIAWVIVEHTTTAAAPGEGADGTVVLPDRIKLISTPPGQSRFEMQLSLSDLKVNPKLTAEQREGMFSVPNIVNARIVDITDQLQRERGATSVRETRPIPASNTGVRLGPPVPIDNEGSGRVDGEPAPLTSDLGEYGGGKSELVGANYPRPSGDDERLAAESQRTRSARSVLEP